MPPAEADDTHLVESSLIRYPRRLLRVAIVVLTWIILFTPLLGAQQSRPIVIEWDPSPGAHAGYVVYVGRSSGAYVETHDVGKATTFSYGNVVVGRWYYFAVAVYSADGARSAPSAELGALMMSSGSIVPLGSMALNRSSGSVERLGSAGSSLSRSLCFVDAPPDCYLARAAAQNVGSVSSLASAPDARLFFIEDGQRIRIVQDTLVEAPALTTPRENVRFEGLALHPDFERTGFVYVGHLETLPGGSRELTIVRYRVVQNSLGEGVALVAGLQVPPGGKAHFTVDASGHLYVAMPWDAALEGTARSAYGGMVLHFNADGTTPRESAGLSPVMARGFQSPSGLLWDGAGSGLWMVGADRDRPDSLVRLSLNGSSSPSPAPLGFPESRVSAVGASPFQLGGLQPEPAGTTSEISTLFLVDSTSHLVRVRFDWGRSSTPSVSQLGSPIEVVAATVARGGTLYLVTPSAATAAGDETYDIMALQRAH